MRIARAAVAQQEVLGVDVLRYGDLLAEAPLGERIILRLNVYNVTDRTYIKNINNNAGRYNPGAPRSFLLSTAIRF